MSSPKSSNRQLMLVALASLALWLVPGGYAVSLPLLYLNTIIHEYCHAAAALATGGYVASIHVFADGSGVTVTAGGISLAIASAGYVGASVVGALLIRSGRNLAAARKALLVLGAIVGLGLVLWVRGDAVGWVMAALWSVALLFLPRRLSNEGATFAARFLGLQQCLYAAQSLYVLLKINAVPGVENDARIASEAFPLPPLAFAVGWCALSVILAAFALWDRPAGVRRHGSG